MGSGDPFFSSPIPIPPNLKFMDANIPFLHSVHQEGGMNIGLIDQEQIMQQNEQQQSIQKKPYRRHTDNQIQEMEAVFKECPHPDDKLRKRLSQDLGLTPRQIRFWFQNHRTQLKVEHLGGGVGRPGGGDSGDDDAIGLTGLGVLPGDDAKCVIGGVRKGCPWQVTRGTDVHTECLYHSLRQPHYVLPCLNSSCGFKLPGQ